MKFNDNPWPSIAITLVGHMFNHTMQNMFRLYHAQSQFLKPLIYGENRIFVILLKIYKIYIFFEKILPMNIFFGSTNQFLQCHMDSCRLNLMVQFHPQPLFQTQANTEIMVRPWNNNFLRSSCFSTFNSAMSIFKSRWVQ